MDHRLEVERLFDEISEDTGFKYNIPDKLYHSLSDFCYSSTQLKYFNSSSPWHFKWKYLSGEREQKKSADLILGNYIHDRFLLPGQAGEHYAIAPDINKRLTSGKEQWAKFQAANRGKEILTSKEYIQANHMLKALCERIPRSFLEGMDVEHALFWKYDGMKLRAKPDFYDPNTRTLWELKTTRKDTRREFERDALNLGYHISLAHYAHGIEMCYGEAPIEYKFLVVNKSEPFHAYVIDVPFEVVMAGDEARLDVLDSLGKCLRTNEWPGMDGEMTVPSWMKGVEDGFADSEEEGSEKTKAQDIWC